MKILIVDDEPLAILRLTKMLENVGFTEILTAVNGKKAVEVVEKVHPHVIFLDIEMPVLTGIEAAPIIKKLSPESKIIFCTAYDEYAINAFDLAASDYLLKPVSKQRLSQALEKVIDKATNQQISFQHGNDFISLSFDEIYCFVSEEKNTFMHCHLGMIIIDESLVKLESKFGIKLLRINRNSLINKDELFGIHRKNSDSFAKLKNTEYKPKISRRNINFVKELLI